MGGAENDRRHINAFIAIIRSARRRSMGGAAGRYTPHIRYYHIRHNKGKERDTIMPARVETVREVNQRIAELCDDFQGCLRYYELNAPDPEALTPHRRAIRMRNGFRSVSAAIDSFEFVEDYLRPAVVALRLDPQASYRIVSAEEMFARLQRHQGDIAELEPHSAADLGNPESVQTMYSLVESLQLSRTNAQVLTGTLALHHLLPRLMPPVDHRFTGAFFRINHYHFSVGAHKGLTRLLNGLAAIVDRLDEQYGEGYLAGLVGSTDWATSETKLLDNAIVGYVKRSKMRLVGSSAAC